MELVGYEDDEARSFCKCFKNWNPKKLWTANSHGVGLGYLFDMVNEIYGKEFIRYKV